MSTQYTNKYTDPVRVNDNCLLKFSYPRDNMDFLKVPYTHLQGQGFHYIEVSGITVNQQDVATSYEADLDSVVWDRGNNTYAHRKNWSYSTGTIYIPQISCLERNKRFINIQFYIPQLFSWDNVQGLLLTIKGCETDDIYINRLFTINDFEYSGEKILRYQQFWLESCVFNIPDSDEEFYAQCTVIHNEDINISGYIYNYPSSFEPIIQSKPLPDYIITQASIDNAGFLHIVPSTLEDKTLENSLKDYFGYSRDKHVNITIQHIVTCSGHNSETGLDENTVTRVSNEENNFNEVVVGLNLSKWIDPSNPEQRFDIVIATEINFDSKIMTRYTSVIADFTTEVINLLTSQNIPSTVVYNKVNEVTEVNQTVIEKPVETQIVKIYQPVFVKYIEKDIKYDNVLISFDNLTQDCYITTDNDSIQSHITSDGVYYFDLKELNPITQDTHYQLVLKESSTIIGEGTILK